MFGGIVDGFESFAEIEHASADFVFACRFEVLLGCEIWHSVFFGSEDTADGGWVSSPKRAVCGLEGGDRCYSGYGLGGMKEIKKSGGGDVRAEALAWDDEWDKA